MKILLVNSVCGKGSTGKICGALAEIAEKNGDKTLIAYGRGAAAENPCEMLDSSSATKSEILDAHQNLVDADAANLAKFEDVISFLKKETEKR